MDPVLRQTEKLSRFLGSDDLTVCCLPPGGPVEQLRRLDFLALRLKFGHGVLSLMNRPPFHDLRTTAPCIRVNVW